MSNQINFYAYIGPRPVMYTQEEAYGKWDWPDEMAASGQPPPFGSPHVPYRGQGTLSASLGAAATTGMVVSGLTLPAAGGVWVGPNGAGQGWEYIEYYNAGANLRREVQAGHSGVHSAGAPVYFWYPLDMNDGNLQISFEQSDNLAVRQWTARLSGVRAPHTILKPEQMIAISADNAPYHDEDQALGLLVGFVERVEMAQDGSLRGTWSLDIVSTARLLQMTSIPSIRIGAFDIALEADAQASTSLGANWKLTLPQREEAAAGTIPQIDMVDLQTDAGPQHLVDGNENTLWVSDGWLGNPALYANSGNNNAWASIFAYPPAANLMGSRYIEIISHDGLDFTWLWVYSKYSYPGGTRGNWFQVSEPNMFQQQGIEVDSLPGAEDRVVVAENAEVFQRLFPSANPTFLIDASTLSGHDRDVVRRLWWEGGAIFMAWSSPENSRGYLWHWGDVTYAELETAWATQGTSDFTLPNSNYYLNIATIQPGQVFRRNLTLPPTTWQFTHDWIHHPGYIIDQDGNQDDAEWIKVMLPAMTHVLRDDISAGSTTIYLIDGQNNPHVEGLSQHGFGGSIIADDEVIPFTGKDYYAGSLTGCTVAQTHKAGTKVYVNYETTWEGQPSNLGYSEIWNVPFKDKIFNVASQGYPIERLEWGRGTYADGSDRHPYLGSYFWRFSLYDQARDPTSESHEEDYLSTPFLDSSSHVPSLVAPNISLDTTLSYYDPTGAGFRPRTMLMQMREMYDAAGLSITARPRLNYVRAFVDRRYFNPDTWIDTLHGGVGYANELVTIWLMERSGLWPDTFVFYYAGDTQLGRQSGVTDRGTAWQVAADNAEYGNSILECYRTGKVRVSSNDFLLAATHTPTKTLTNKDVLAVQIANIRPSEVGQVRLTWESGDGKASGIAVYPAELPRGSSLVEIGPFLADSQAHADMMALNHYRIKRFAYNVFVELVVSDALPTLVQLGEIHQLDYDWHQTGEITRKLLLVESVEYNIARQTLSCVVGYREIDREHV